MKQVRQNDEATRRPNLHIAQRGRRSAMQLLAAGAICAANPALAQDGTPITNATEFANLLNVGTVGELEITGGNIDLSPTSPFTLSATDQIIQGDGTTRVLSNGNLTILAPRILALNPDVTWDGTINVNGGARLDLTAPTTLGGSATVNAPAQSEVRIFGLDDTYDGTFWAKVNGVNDLTTISFAANETTITALPTFDAILSVVVYDSFQFANDPLPPLTDPTLTLGASLSGNHAFNLETGTLDLDDFDFTIDSLTGAADTEITLGSGTLTTGDALDTTFAGVISGTGNLTKTGTGVFTLTDTNTYTGTTTVSGGRLVFDADQTGHTAIVIENTGTLRINVDQTSTPTIDIQAGGTLDLFADLADTIAVTVDGMMDLNNRDQTFAAIDGGGTVTLGAADLTVGDGTSTTFSGVISGLGGLTKVGAGTLTLSGANTYTGSTLLNEGSLVVDGSLSGSGTVTLADGTTLTLNGDLNNSAAVTLGTGATLDLNGNNETIGSINGAGDVTLGAGTLTVGGGTLGGTISGSGGLTKQNAGTLTLSSAQTYTGATSITGGRLVANGDLATSGVTVGSGATFNLEGSLTNGSADVTVDNGGTFFGTATIGNDLINNGTVTLTGPGAGDTLTVNGDYTQGATGTLSIQLGNAGGLNVTGTATVDGTLNILGPSDPSTFDISATYTAINAGSIAGTFATVTDNFVFLDLSNANVGGNIEITLTRNAVSLAEVAQNSNQTAVATVLNGLGAPTGTLDAAINRVLASSAAQARTLYDQLAGAGSATVSTQVTAAAANQTSRVLDQAIGIFPGTNRPVGAFTQRQSPGFSILDDTDHLTLFSYSQFEGEEEETEEPASGRFSSLDPTAWGFLYGGLGDQGEGAEGLDYWRYGVLFGLELESAESDARYGVSLGVEQTEFDFSQNNGEVDVASVYLSGYTRQPFGNNYHFTLSGAFGLHSHESDRTILIGVTPTRASADFNSYSFSIAAELSKSFTLTDTPEDPGGHPSFTSIEPFARIGYSISTQDSYSETGAGTAALNVDSNDFDSVRAAGGLRVQHEFMLANEYEATIQGRALVDFALSNSDSDLNVSFVGTPGSGFAIEGSDQDDIFGQIGLTLSIEIDDDWDLHFSADQQFSDEASATLISGGLSYSF